MALPIILPSGTIAVYGVGQSGAMPSGVIVETTWRFGTIYNIWDGGATFVYGGDVVMWKDGNEYTRLATTEGTWTIIPARLVTKDIPPIP